MSFSETESCRHKNLCFVVVVVSVFCITYVYMCMCFRLLLCCCYGGGCGGGSGGMCVRAYVFFFGGGVSGVGRGSSSACASMRLCVRVCACIYPSHK